MWAQLTTIALGIWLMAAPAVMEYSGAARLNHQIVGPIIATFAWIAAAECTNGLRRANLPLGVWLMISPLVIAHDGVTVSMNAVMCGVAVAALSSIRRSIRTRLGGGWRVLWRFGGPAR